MSRSDRRKSRRPSGGVLIGLVAVAGLTCTPRRDVGRQCVFNSDCAEGLICAGTYCRRPCTTDRDCPANGVCRSTGERDLLGCFDRGAPQLCVYASDCTDGLVCTIDGTCGPECTRGDDCTLRVGRTQCDLSRGVCVPDTDASSPDATGTDGAVPPDAAPASDAARDGSADGAGS